VCNCVAAELCLRRCLTSCPTLESEDQLRLLNFQHNTIRTIENVDNLRRLIFLDFYDNHLEQIDGLSALRSLRVLMLGKNRSRFAYVFLEKKQVNGLVTGQWLLSVFGRAGAAADL